MGCKKKEEDILIYVGNKKISSSQFKKDFEEYKSFYKNDNKANILATFISNTIEREILKLEAKKMNIEVTKDEITNFLKSNNLTDKHIPLAELTLLREKIVSSISKNVSIDNNLIEERVKNLPDVQPEKIIFYQILTNKEEIAYKALDELKKGEKFEEVAKKYSISPEGQRGGLIDYLNTEDIPLELVNTLKKLKEGELSSVIKSSLGFHILKLKYIIKAKKLSSEEKISLAKEELLKELAGNIYADWFAEKRKEYGVKVEWEKIKALER